LRPAGYAALHPTSRALRRGAASPTSDHSRGMIDSGTTRRPRVIIRVPSVRIVVRQGATPNIGPAHLSSPARNPGKGGMPMAYRMIAAPMTHRRVNAAAGERFRNGSRPRHTGPPGQHGNPQTPGPADQGGQRISDDTRCRKTPGDVPAPPSQLSGSPGAGRKARPTPVFAGRIAALQPGKALRNPSDAQIAVTPSLRPNRPQSCDPVQSAVVGKAAPVRPSVCCADRTCDCGSFRALRKTSRDRTPSHPCSRPVPRRDRRS